MLSFWVFIYFFFKTRIGNSSVISVTPKQLPIEIEHLISHRRLLQRIIIMYYIMPFFIDTQLVNITIYIMVYHPEIIFRQSNVRRLILAAAAAAAAAATCEKGLVEKPSPPHCL